MADKPEFKDLGLGKWLKRISDAGLARIRVGVVGAKAGEPSGDGRVTVAEAALINEYGAEATLPSGVKIKIPERSFLRKPLTQRNPAVFKLMNEFTRKVVDNEGTVDDAAHEAGKGLAEISKRAITSGIPPENTDETERKKGFNHPLIHTHALVDAISHRVVRENGDVLEDGASSADYDALEYSTEGGE